MLFPAIDAKADSAALISSSLGRHFPLYFSFIYLSRPAAAAKKYSAVTILHNFVISG